MSFEARELPGLTVLGIAARASNAEPQRIGELWRSFHAQGDAKSIPGRLEDSIYSVYCEYAGDWIEEYTVVIGCAVDSTATVPEGMKKIEIAAGRFAVLQPQGELPQSVFDAWAEVWRTPLARRYQADFDRYGADGAVSINVGIA